MDRINIGDEGTVGKVVSISYKAYLAELQRQYKQALLEPTRHSKQTAWNGLWEGWKRGEL